MIEQEILDYVNNGACTQIYVPLIIIHSDGKQYYKPKKIEFQNPLHIAGETLFTLVDRSARILLDKKQIGRNNEEGGNTQA